MYDNLDKETLLKNIMSLDFSINDLSLYLDTHPNDRNALDKHLEYVKKYNELVSIYENKFGPLTLYTEQNTWEWGETMWPWERRAR